MTVDQLRAAGEALFGDQWQRPLARALKVSDRTVRRWLAGDRAIPEDLITLLRDLGVSRIRAIKRL